MVGSDHLNSFYEEEETGCVLRCTQSAIVEVN